MGRFSSHWPDNDHRPWPPALPTCRQPHPWRPPEFPWHTQDPCCCDDSSIKVRLFENCARPCDSCRRQIMPAAHPVTIVNPWNCRECAQVTLGVDECGNLVVCIKR